MVSLLNLLGGNTPAVTWERYLGDDGEARPTYAAPVLVAPVRVTPHAKLVQLADGRVVTASHIVSVPGDLTPAPGDRVTIAGAVTRVWGVDTPVWLDATPMHHKLTVGPG